MAKKKTLHRGTSRWKAAPNDAIRLAALHWFALTIEKVSVELYATNPASFPEMEKVLRKTLNAMGGLRDDFAIANDDCPEGWILCDDRVCAPACDRMSDS